jgi:hypothetical protein
MARKVFDALTYTNPQRTFAGGVNFTPTLNKLDDIYKQIDSRPIVSTNSLKADISKARKLDFDYEKGIQEAIGTGDPHRALAMTKQSAARRAAELANEGTDVGAITKSLSNYNTSLEQISKLGKEYNKQYANLNVEKHVRRHAKGGGTVREENGLGHKILGIAPMIEEQADLNTLADNLGKGWEYNQGGGQAKYTPTADGLYMESNGKSWKISDEKEILKAVSSGLGLDAKLKRSLQQDAELDVFNSILQSAKASGMTEDAAREAAIDALNEGSNLKLGDKEINVNDLMNQMMQEKMNTAARNVAEKYGFVRTETNTRLDKAAGADENALRVMPTGDLTGIVNNPNAIPNLESLSENSGVGSQDWWTEPGKVQSKMASEGFGYTTDGSGNRQYLQNGRPTTKEVYDKAFNQAKEATQLSKTNIAEFAKSKYAQEKFGPILNDIISGFPKDKNESQEAYNERIKGKLNQVANASKTYKYNFQAMHPKLAEEATAYTFGTAKKDKDGNVSTFSPGTISNRPIFHNGQQETLASLAKKLGVTEADIIANGSVIGDTKGDAWGTPSGNQANIVDKDGKIHQIIVGSVNLQRDKVQSGLYKAVEPLRNFKLKKSENFTMEVPDGKGGVTQVKAKSIPLDIWKDSQGNEYYSGDGGKWTDGNGIVYNSIKDIKKGDLNFSGDRIVVIDDGDNEPTIVTVSGGKMGMVGEQGLPSIDQYKNIVNQMDVYRNVYGDRNSTSKGEAKISK